PARRYRGRHPRAGNGLQRDRDAPGAERGGPRRLGEAQGMTPLEAAYPQPVHGQNFYALDRNLVAALTRSAPELLARHGDVLHKVGAWVGNEADAEAAYTDRFAPPVLEPYDAQGLLVNRIRHNPKWEETVKTATRLGFVGLNYGP